MVLTNTANGTVAVFLSSINPPPQHCWFLKERFVMIQYHKQSVSTTLINRSVELE